MVPYVPAADLGPQGPFLNVVQNVMEGSGVEAGGLNDLLEAQGA